MGGRPLARTAEHAVGVAQLHALGTKVTLAVDHDGDLRVAEAVLRHELAAVDRACSRFRSDSEIQNLSAMGGHPVRVSELLYEAVSVACVVAERTGGSVDPTVGHAVAALGYDRDFAEVAKIGEPLPNRPLPAPGWWLIEFDERTRSIAVPPGVSLDLGASAKALVADGPVPYRIDHQVRRTGLRRRRRSRFGSASRNRMACWNRRGFLGAF